MNLTMNKCAAALITLLILTAPASFAAEKAQTTPSLISLYKSMAMIGMRGSDLESPTSEPADVSPECIKAMVLKTDMIDAMLSNSPPSKSINTIERKLNTPEGHAVIERFATLAEHATDYTDDKKLSLAFQTELLDLFAILNKNEWDIVIDRFDQIKVSDSMMDDKLIPQLLKLPECRSSILKSLQEDNENQTNTRAEPQTTKE